MVLINEARKTLYKLAKRVFGSDHQIAIANEEYAESIVALNQFKRGKIELEDLQSEIADAMIVTEQMYLMFNDDNGIDVQMERKLARLQRRCNKNDDLMK